MLNIQTFAYTESISLCSNVPQIHEILDENNKLGSYEETKQDKTTIEKLKREKLLPQIRTLMD